VSKLPGTRGGISIPSGGFVGKGKLNIGKDGTGVLFEEKEGAALASPEKSFSKKNRGPGMRKK